MAVTTGGHQTKIMNDNLADSDWFRVEEYSVRGKEPRDEVQIYTWYGFFIGRQFLVLMRRRSHLCRRDATLREITDLIREVNYAAMRRDARLSFCVVYPDKRGVSVMKEVGNTFSSRKSEDDDKSLQLLRFQTGDFLDVAVYVN